MDPERQEVLRELAADRWRAHSFLFAHRHPNQSCSAHHDLVAGIHGPAPRVLLDCFRGLGKSTYTEEAICLNGAFGAFGNGLLVGASYERACERLAAVKREFDQNAAIEAIFGPMRGSIWQEGRITLSNGSFIQALGRDQSLRGTKYLDRRPDFVLIDDIENPEEVLTPRGREKTWNWFLQELLPALEHPAITPVRVLATIMHEDSFAVRLGKQSAWNKIRIPIESVGENGERVATWKAKFPLPVIDQMKTAYRSNMAAWEREYMCNAAAVSQYDFTPEMVRVVPRTRTWEATYAMYDPARTTRAQSATTGKVVWSWIKNRLVIWDAQGSRWKPDEIIDDVFKTQAEYGPVWVGVEEDGLNEFILQPLRHEQLKRGLMVPIKAVKAPRGKLDFIRALQPYFAAGEVEFAKPLPDLEAQLLSFPTGDIDVPNALAYALTLRPAAPIYEGFETAHVADSLALDRARPTWLAVNASKTIVTAALVQYGFGRITIPADFVMEGEPQEVVPWIVREASMFARANLTAVCGPEHYDRYMNVGLVQALQKIPLSVDRGTPPAKGREALRGEFSRLVRGEPAVRVSRMAPRVLNALAGGYTRQLGKGGALHQEAEPGLYRTLMEGLESCLGSIAVDDSEREGNYAYTASGQRYLRYQSAHQARAS